MVEPSLLVKLVAGAIAVWTSLRVGVGVYVWRETEKLERPAYQVLRTLSLPEDGTKIELRRYEPYLVAETVVEGVGFREPTAPGFRACAAYIFGQNQKREARGLWSLRPFLPGLASLGPKGGSEKMAMTAPVRVSSQIPKTGEKMAMTAPVRVVAGAAAAATDEGGAVSSRTTTTKVSFVLGKQYTRTTAPVPLNRQVKLRTVPAHTLAVRTFAGPPPTDDRVLRERELIDRALAQSGLRAKDDSETLVYGYHDPFLTPNILRRNEVAVVVEGSI